MSKLIIGPNGQKITIIQDEPDKFCQFCQMKKDCRPYGPEEKLICMDCALTSEELAITVEQNMRKVLFGTNDSRAYCKKSLTRRGILPIKKPN